ncbi:hypothetical protein [Prosthecodimorpha hirschii]|uniref:hypothetical protein n=1 Tax=Prosthecodimorpha hirschii TaxID=665126 RepID=UPI001FEDAA0B|nr:hypothetical protein [Prosthecomicrobium hirschii]
MRGRAPLIIVSGRDGSGEFGKKAAGVDLKLVDQFGQPGRADDRDQGQNAIIVEIRHRSFASSPEARS